MLKKFSLWLEEREKTRRIKQLIFDRLNFSDEIDPSTIKIQGLEMLSKAVDELGIEDESTVESLKNWIKTNKGATLTQFLMQIDPDDVPDQEEVPGEPAELPPEQAVPDQQQGQPDPNAMTQQPPAPEMPMAPPPPQPMPKRKMTF